MHAPFAAVKLLKRTSEPLVEPLNSTLAGLVLLLAAMISRCCVNMRFSSRSLLEPAQRCVSCLQALSGLYLSESLCTSLQWPLFPLCAALLEMSSRHDRAAYISVSCRVFLFAFVFCLCLSARLLPPMRYTLMHLPFLLSCVNASCVCGAIMWTALTSETFSFCTCLTSKALW